MAVMRSFVENKTWGLFMLVAVAVASALLASFKN